MITARSRKKSIFNDGALFLSWGSCIHNFFIFIVSPTWKKIKGNFGLIFITIQPFFCGVFCGIQAVWLLRMAWSSRSFWRSHTDCLRKADMDIRFSF